MAGRRICGSLKRFHYFLSECTTSPEYSVGRYRFAVPKRLVRWILQHYFVWRSGEVNALMKRASCGVLGATVIQNWVRAVDEAEIHESTVLRYELESARYMEG